MNSSSAAIRNATMVSKRASRLPFMLACGVSVALHAMILSITFSGDTPSLEKDRGLEVVLVNARHDRAPEQADVLAQANLDGGGTTDDEDARPSSPLPPREQRADGAAVVDTQRAEQPLPQDEPKAQEKPTPQPAAKEEQAKIVTPEPKAPPKPQPSATPPKPAKPAVSGHDLMDSLAAIAKLEAQIDRRLDEYAKRPRKTQIGARAKEHRFALYAENWRRKVERVGTLNYPHVARGRIYGNLVLTIAIRADGSLERVHIDRSSGQKVLDDAAIQIVRMASPYAAFPPDIRADTDIIEITRTWNFTRSEELTTR
ncbi:MAG TPA: energy transducer TonB [Azoarcus sp.]|nr:energy transducer TonB [Azoarcus sp.]